MTEERDKAISPPPEIQEAAAEAQVVAPNESDVESAAVKDLEADVRREVAETKKYGDDVDWAPIPVGGQRHQENGPLDPEDGWKKLENP